MPDAKPTLRDFLPALLDSFKGLNLTLSGWKTYLAAAVTAGFGAFLAYQSNPELGIASILVAAIGAALRAAIPEAVPAPAPAPADPSKPPTPADPDAPRWPRFRKILLAAAAAAGSFFGFQSFMPSKSPLPIPPQPAPPAPPGPTPPAPRPSDEHGGQMWDAYQKDGGGTEVNAKAKKQLAAIYAVAARLAADKSVATGEDLLKRVQKASTTITDEDYLSAIPQLRRTVNGIVSDHLDPDALTDASRESAARLFQGIAKSLGEF